MFKDIGGYDVKYEEFEELCRKAWDERLRYLCIDITRNKKEGKYRIFNEGKNTYVECTPEGKAFEFCIFYIQIKTEMITESYTS